MMYLQQVMDKIAEYLVNDRPVYVTDGTVTRRVVFALVYNRVLSLNTDQPRECVEIPEAVLSQLDGWGMQELSDGLFIAPEWWIAI